MAKIATAQILTDLHAEILSDSGVTALIGSRLRYGKARQNEAKPYVTYQILTKIPTLTHDGDASQCSVTDSIRCLGGHSLPGDTGSRRSRIEASRNQNKPRVDGDSIRQS
jgi:hypothetical protein